jgi:hypothetical protein
MTMPTDRGTPNRAVILRFPSRRGRPRKSLPKKDGGTPELIRKRHAGETIEALDLCLAREIITSEQHWCGIHLRWLYTLRHGVPSVRAIDPTHLGGMEIKLDDPEWKSAREAEYHEALNALHRGGCAIITMNLCIYNERPDFLKQSSSRKLLHTKATKNFIADIIKGLDILAALWIKRR